MKTFRVAILIAGIVVAGLASAAVRMTNSGTFVNIAVNDEVSK